MIIFFFLVVLLGMENKVNSLLLLENWKAAVLKIFL